MEGVAVRNSAYYFKTIHEVDNFIKYYEDWNKKMLSIVEKLSPAGASTLKILDKFPLTKRPEDVNSDHSKYLSMFSEKLTRLFEFINDYTLAYHSK
jgi:hypothetical protein